MRVHASCVAFDGRGVLLCGPSGAGKSDLALRAIEAGARLVADDVTVLSLREGSLWAAPLPQAGGRLEVRGLGILRFEALEGAPLVLAVDLQPPERLPEEEWRAVLGRPLRHIRLQPFEISAAIKLRLAARLASEDKGGVDDAGRR